MSLAGLVLRGRGDIARKYEGKDSFVRRYFAGDASFAVPVTEAVLNRPPQVFEADPELNYDVSFRAPDNIDEDAADYTELVPKKSHEEVLRELLSQSEID